MAITNSDRELTVVFHDSEGDGYVAEFLELESGGGAGADVWSCYEL